MGNVRVRVPWRVVRISIHIGGDEMGDVRMQGRIRWTEKDRVEGALLAG